MSIKESQAILKHFIDLKSSSEQIVFRKLSLGAPGQGYQNTKWPAVFDLS